jgi:signal transduction histidine kinase
MKVESTIAWGGRLTAVLALAVSAGIVLLLVSGYRATRAWERSSAQLVERDTEESADQLVNAIRRDMQGAQSRVLANRDWGELSIDSLADMSEQVATAFARYPYPESFFAWRETGPRTVTFFNRANRFPRWMPQPDKLPLASVVVANDPPGSADLRAQVNAHAVARFQYVAFDRVMAGEPYQFVARLTYADPLQERLESAIGFTVNLAWVRDVYFSEMVSQIGPIVNRGSRLEIAVVDHDGRVVSGRAGSRPGLSRPLPILFFDPTAGVSMVAPDTGRAWTIRVNQARDSALVSATQGADEMLLISGAAALTLAVALMLALRSVRAGIALAAMRSEFVSSVTHELKMPLANIQMMADTLARRPIGADTIRNYADFLQQEAKRLRRLVDNLLAYARVTDVANVYSLEALAVAELIDDVLQGFRQPIADRGFTVDVSIPVDLPLVFADRAAMLLAFGNLVDNAIRYSPEAGSLMMSARRDGGTVFVDVRDRGAGISATELPAVRGKFVRGRFTRAHGSGLGLAIVSRIVADHRGSFTLESELGAGTVATVGLPIAEGEG